MIIEKGQFINRDYGFYSDEVECFNNSNHKVLWWYGGVFCLNDKNYVKAKTKTKDQLKGKQ